MYYWCGILAINSITSLQCSQSFQSLWSFCWRWLLRSWAHPHRRWETCRLDAPWFSRWPEKIHIQSSRFWDQNDWLTIKFHTYRKCQFRYIYIYIWVSDKFRHDQSSIEMYWEGRGVAIAAKPIGAHPKTILQTIPSGSFVQGAATAKPIEAHPT